MYDSEGRIEFRGLQRSDSGEYECVASNEAGTGKAVVTLYYTSESVVTLYYTVQSVVHCSIQVNQWSHCTIQVRQWSHCSVQVSGHIVLCK